MIFWCKDIKKTELNKIKMLMKSLRLLIFANLGRVYIDFVSFSFEKQVNRNKGVFFPTKMGACFLTNKMTGYSRTHIEKAINIASYHSYVMLLMYKTFSIP
jgi:hypothetical protein